MKKSIGALLALASLLMGSVAIAANFSVTPNANNFDNLIGATNTRWNFVATTTAELAANDVIQVVFPSLNNAQPFDPQNATQTSLTGAIFYSSLGQPLSNLISNPSFELSLASWSATSTSGASLATSTTKYHGNLSLSLVGTSTPSGYAMISQSANVTSDTTNTLSFYARGASGGEKIRLMLAGTAACEPGNVSAYNFVSSSWACVSMGPDFFASTSAYILDSQVTNSFARFTRSFRTDGASLSVRFLTGGDGVYASQTLYLDAVQLENAAAVTDFNVGGVGNPTPGISIGGNGQTSLIFGYVTSTYASGSAFSLSVSGINNGAGERSGMGNLTWTLKGGTPSQGNPSELSTTKFSVTATSSLVRTGAGIVSDQNNDLYISNTATSSYATFTISFTATTAIPVGGKVVLNIPTEFSITSIDVPAQNINASTSAYAQIAAGAYTTTSEFGKKRISFITSNATTSPGDKITVTVGNIGTPSLAGVYRPLFVYTAASNGGVIDGSYFGFEQADMITNQPPPQDAVHIGGNNTINVVVKKKLTATTSAILSAGERAQVKVVAGCPDKQFFAGQRWLSSTSEAVYRNLLDCNYMMGTEPFDKGSQSFYNTFLAPSMKNVNANGGVTVTTTIYFGVPDATTTGQLTGGVAGQNAFIMAYSPEFMSFTDVYTDQTYTTPGFDGSGNGYYFMRVASGQTWNFEVEGGQYGNSAKVTDAQGQEYWPPASWQITPTANTTTNAGSQAYVLANKDLVVKIYKAGTSDPITNACVGVMRSTGGIMQGAGGEMVCSPNFGDFYKFKVPAGSLAIELGLPGSGQPKQFPVSVSSTVATTTKEINISSPTSYITANVTDGTNVIKGASVSAHGSNGNANAMTNASGTAILYLAEGIYTVEGFAPNFGQLTAQSATITAGSNPTVTFTVNTGDLKRITGAVTMGGTAVSGVKIGARRTDGTMGGNGTETNSDGTYTLYVPAATYEVGGWSPSTGGLQGQNVDVRSANATANWALGAQGTLRITVQNAQNISQLFGGAFNSTTGRGNGASTWTATGSSKVADIVLPAGTYDVRVGSPMIGEISTPGDTVTITGGTVSSKTYDAQASSTLVTLSGAVTAGGSGIAGINVWASAINSPLFFSTTTNGSGDYTISLPDAKTYRVGVKSLGYIANEGDVSVTMSGNKTQDFTLGAAGATITGRVLGSGGSGLANSWVSAKKIIGNYEVWAGAPTDDNGNYTLNIDSGSWTVFAEGPCYQRSTGLDAAAGSSGKNISLTAISGCTPPTPQISGVSPAAGGQLNNNGILINIPANALGTGSDNVSISVATASVAVRTANAKPLSNSVQRISVTDSSGQTISNLNSKASVTISYNEADLPVGFSENNIQLGYFDSTTGNWETVPATIDTTLNTLSAEVSHFSDYGPILPPVPDQTTGLTATAASVSQIDLVWTATTDATSYNIYRSLTNSGFTTLLATTTATSYSDTGLTAQTTYYYQVAAVNDSGAGPNSASANAQTSAVVASVVATAPGSNTPAPVKETTVKPAVVKEEKNIVITVEQQKQNLIALILQLLASGKKLPSLSAILAKPSSVAPILPMPAILLKLGSVGDEVTILQKRLSKLGYFKHPYFTKYFGLVTQEAVKKFQIDKGIMPTLGIFGPKTRAVLEQLGQ
ncbi:MAG: carboxypeptidase regulatory-like domain-containing protein [Candidatus Paceibacterota bacterium]